MMWLLKTPFRVNSASSVNIMQFNAENQRAPKLALFECGMDIILVLLTYDALQIVKLSSKSANADVGLFFDAFQNLFFSLQFSFGPMTATIVSLRFEGTMISQMLYH